MKHEHIVGIGFLAATLIGSGAFVAFMMWWNALTPARPAAASDPSIPVPWSPDMASRYAGPYLHLRDPFSAVFTGTTYRTRHGWAYTCGYVNAKSASGGYTGPKAFIIGDRDGPFIEGETPTITLRAAWQKDCVETDASERTVGQEVGRNSSGP